jgi:hypothetical protein
MIVYKGLFSYELSNLLSVVAVVTQENPSRYEGKSEQQVIDELLLAVEMIAFKEQFGTLHLASKSVFFTLDALGQASVFFNGVEHTALKGMANFYIRPRQKRTQNN